MITKEVKIAHLSDLHISGPQDIRQLEHLDRMLEHFNADGFDHVVISGDLSHNADQREWELVRDKLKAHGLYHWEKTTVVAGNHDLINLEEEMRFYNALNPLPRVRKKAFERKLASFCEFFQELITGEERTDAAFPFVKIINYQSLRIAITALNTVYPWYPAENPLGARGWITPGQLRALKLPEVSDSLADCFVIGLCHHAFKVYGTDSLIDQAFDWTMELKNRDEFFEVMKAIDAKLVLHGHFHRFQSYEVNGLSFFNGGSFKYSPMQYSELIIGQGGEFRQRFTAVV